MALQYWQIGPADATMTIPRLTTLATGPYRAGRYDGHVFELLIVVALVVAVVVVAVAPWSSLFIAGVLTTAAGLAFGLTTGFWYHVALGRALSASGALTPRWWWRPVPLHQRLPARARRRVMPWFYAGAAGFFVTVAGMALIALAIAVGALRTE